MLPCRRRPCRHSVLQLRALLLIFSLAAVAPCHRMLQLRALLKKIFLAGGDSPRDLYENKTVIELRMGANKIGPAGAEAIANMLKENKNSKLSNLDISLNNIGPQGAKHIAEAIQENKTVIELRMEVNKIGPAGAEAIANMLKVNLTLTALDFGRNGTGPQGAQSIADAIKLFEDSAIVLEWNRHATARGDGRDVQGVSSPAVASLCNYPGAIAASPASNSFSGCCIAASTASKFCSGYVAKEQTISTEHFMAWGRKALPHPSIFFKRKSCRKEARERTHNFLPWPHPPPIPSTFPALPLPAVFESLTSPSYQHADPGREPSSAR
eukprot:g39104.t1